MAFALGDIFKLYGDALVGNKMGYDWKDKLAAGRADIAGRQASTAATQASTQKAQFEFEQAQKERQELERLHAEGRISASTLNAIDAIHKQEAEKRAQGAEGRAQSAEGRATAAEGRAADLYPTTKAMSQAQLTNEQNQQSNAEKLARIRAEGSGGGGSMAGRFATGPDGKLRFYTNRELAGDDSIQPAPSEGDKKRATAKAAMGPAFETVNSALNNLEEATKTVGGRLSGLVPGTAAWYAKDRFIGEVKSFLATLVAKRSGEERITDQDTQRYARALTLGNSLLLLPGGVQEARERLIEAQELIRKIDEPDEPMQPGGAGGGALGPSGVPWAQPGGPALPGLPAAPAKGGLRVISIEKIQ